MAEELDQFIRRSTLPDPMDVVFGLVAIVLLLELSWRVVDNTFITTPIPGTSA